ncbi:helix-turn-helix domain-containing protein [Flavobacterium sp.]|uniref:helix-turn-helix domain-containing protein n=1 Tax=Flavobacterium sp. TaxID=239 RepID=UPI0037BE8747
MHEILENKEIISKITVRIKKLRMLNNISQEKFYFDTGIHISRIEQGKSNPTIYTLYRICSYFNVTLSDFFKNIEEVN